MFEPRLTKRQSQAFLAFNDKEVVDLLYGGAKGGGKSFFFCWLFYFWVNAIAQQFDLPVTNNPPHLAWMGRKQSVDFTGTTLQTWKSIIPPDEYVIKSGSKKDPAHIVVNCRVAIDFGGLDRQEYMSHFNSAEYVMVGVDQAEETTADDVATLRGSRRKKINGRELKYKGLFTANPAQCWLKQEFIDNPNQGNKRFIQALPADNPHLPVSYIQTLTDSFGHRPELLEAYLRGNWNAMDGANQVIKSGWVQKILEQRFRSQMMTRFISADIARYGDCETVAYVMDNDDIIPGGEHIWGQTDFVDTADRLHIISSENGDCPIVLDDVEPYGAAVADNLRKKNVYVIGLAACSPPESGYDGKGDERYYNLRAQMWWEAGKEMSRGDGGLSHNDPVLIRQLTSIRYKYRNSKILLESKEEMRERGVQSPDRADAYIQGRWAKRKVQAVRRDSPQQVYNHNSAGCVPSTLKAGVS